MKNILRNFWVTLTRFKIASILNILGLTVAFTVFIVIMAQTYWELTYNKNIKQHEQIYGLTYDPETGVMISRPLAEAICKPSPVIEAYTTMWGGWEQYVKAFDMTGQVRETLAPVYQVSSGFIDVFSLESVSGDLKRFEEPNAIIISKYVADILFPDNDAVGNNIIFEDTLQVMAVYKDFPENCSFKNGLFVNIGNDYIDDWSEWSFSCFCKLLSSDARSEFEKSASKMAAEIFSEGEDEIYEEENLVVLEPFSNLYFSNKWESSFPTGNLALTRLLISIAVIIILIAVINYINFFMALVPIRIRAVNINKVFGTPTSVLRFNIIGEAVGLLLLSFGLVLLLLEFLSGTFVNDLIVTSLKINDNLPLVFVTGFLMIVTGIFTGLFPAFYITRFHPALVLKGSFGRSKQGQRLRSILIIFQFTISIILVICAGFLYLQNRYMQKYDYGFNRDRLITVRVGNRIASQPQAFLSELKKNPSIEGVAYADNSIGNIAMKWGRIGYNGEQIKFTCLPVSWNYPEFMNLTLIEGRFFNENDLSKIGGTIIFNESAAKKYNIKTGDVVGGHHDSIPAEVVGIVKNFNFSSLQNEIEPLALYEFGSEGWRIPSEAHIRLSPNADFKPTIDFIAACMKEINPNVDIEKIKIYPFDDTIESLYLKEIKIARIISLFSLVAIIISLMGIFGIVVFENQHRRKEIALRKVHGSTTILILGMLNRKFIYILLISFVIAAPIAYFAVVKWLSGFAYQTPVYWWVFVLGFLVVVFITLLIVTLQTYRTANENPIKAIKTE